MATSPAEPAASSGPATSEAPSGGRVHLTIDDLPWQMERGQTMALPAEEVARWNQRLLKVLQRHGVEASAFFTCDRIQQGDGTVKAWTDAGHAIGNHTASHLPAKEVGPEAFLENTASCQKTLTDAGAEVRWFRYPYLGYGADAASQQAIAEGLTSMGLRNLPVTASNSEWVYATAYRQALVDGDVERQARIRKDYVDYMLQALDAAHRISGALEGRPIPQTMLIHANELNGHVLDELLARYEASGVAFVSADVAMADPVFGKPIQRVETWAVPWVVRVHPPVGEPAEGMLRWFSEAERRAVQAWPLPPSPWHRGVPMKVPEPGPSR